jgi:hypothetical protein
MKLLFMHFSRAVVSLCLLSSNVPLKTLWPKYVLFIKAIDQVRIYTKEQMYIFIFMFSNLWRENEKLQRESAPEITIYSFIREVSGSNFGWASKYLGRDFSCLYLVPPGSC